NERGFFISDICGIFAPSKNDCKEIGYSKRKKYGNSLVVAFTRDSLFRRRRTGIGRCFAGKTDWYQSPSDRPYHRFGGHQRTGVAGKCEGGSQRTGGPLCGKCAGI